MTQPFHKSGDPFGIYVHWPFCAAKCPYCDFNSHVRHKPVEQKLFIEAYGRELAYMASLLDDGQDRQVDSIFFGGGTPSLMEAQSVETILAAIRDIWPLADNVEITLEANPSSVEAERFADYRKAGINRLSLGVQSFDDDELKFLGRLHDSAQAKKAIELANKIFPRFSFDLIYARPKQSEKAWQKELNEALEMTGDHLSLYQLTIEQGTPFFALYNRNKLDMPDGDHAARLYEITQEIMNAAKMPAYEISNHAGAGAQSRHNLTYWHYHDYVGIGPGAHGRLTIGDKKHATATWRNPEQWWQQVMVKSHGLENFEALSASEAADEFALMGLRLSQGIDLERLSRISKSAINTDSLDQLFEYGFLETTENERLRVTQSGMLVLDAVVADLLA